MLGRCLAHGDRSGYCCYFSSLLPPPHLTSGRQAGGAQACPRVHQNPASRTAEPAKQTCRPSAGRREQGEGVLAQGWAGIPEGAAQGGVAPSAGAILVFLGFSSAVGSGPCPPPGAGGLCSLAPVPEGGCQEGANRGSPRVSSESSHEACSLPGGARRGLSWWRRSQRGLSLVPEPPPHPPGESQESRDHPELCVPGPCLWGWGGGHGAKGGGETGEGTGEAAYFCPHGAASQPSGCNIFILLKEEGNRHLPSTHDV